MINAPKEIRDFLMTNPALVGFVGNRLYAERDQPPAGYSPDQGGSITFQMRGGTVSYDDALYRPSVQFKCYGKTEAGSYEIYRALYDALHGGSDDNLVHAEIEMLGRTLEELDTGWLFTVCAFMLILRED